MADFILGEGEHIVEVFRVTTRTREYGTMPKRLILTNERVALCRGGLLVSLLDMDHEPIEQEIAREDFAEVEVDGKSLVIRSTGEGYGRTTIIVETKDAQRLQQCLHQWAAGESMAAPLPQARLVRKD
jgi:hypothetical protein